MNVGKTRYMFYGHPYHAMGIQAQWHITSYGHELMTRPDPTGLI